jgi:hypothetical protein
MFVLIRALKIIIVLQQVDSQRRHQIVHDLGSSIFSTFSAKTEKLTFGKSKMSRADYTVVE